MISERRFTQTLLTAWINCGLRKNRAPICQHRCAIMHWYTDEQYWLHMILVFYFIFVYADISDNRSTGSWALQYSSQCVFETTVPSDVVSAKPNSLLIRPYVRCWYCLTRRGDACTRPNPDVICNVREDLYGAESRQSANRVCIQSLWITMMIWTVAILGQLGNCRQYRTLSCISTNYITS